MSEIDFQSLLDKHDKSDMARFTRNFVDDLEAAMSAEIEIEADMDWSGVVCLGMGGSGAGGITIQYIDYDLVHKTTHNSGLFHISPSRTYPLISV